VRVNALAMLGSTLHCSRCGCRLARDHQGPTCSPCARTHLLDRLSGLAPTTDVPLRDLRAAMADGGLPALAELTHVDLPGAAELTLSLRLLPARCRIPPEVLRALAATPKAANTTLAERFGVSRWAVAGWRRLLLAGPTSPSDFSSTKTMPRPANSAGAAARNRSMPDSATRSTTEALHVDVLGPLVVRAGDATLALARQSRTLLSALALAHPAGLTIDTLAAVLTPDHSPAAGRRALHAAVWRLRKTVPETLVATVGSEYRLVLTAGARLDVADFVEAARAARDALLDERFEDARSAAVQGLSRWRGTPAVSAPALRERLATLAELRDSVIEDLGQSLLRLGQAAEAAVTLRPLTEQQPLRERAAALLIEAYRRLGQQADVADAVTRVESALADIGIDAGRQLRQAIDDARAGRRSAAPTAVPRAAGSDEVPPLPAWLRVAAQGAFLGREEELTALLEAMDPPAADDGLRVVLVNGEAGAGKTRVVAEAATVTRGRDLAVWAGRSDPYGAIPFAALVDALHRPLSDALDAVDGDPAQAWMTEPVWGLLRGPAPDRPAGEAAIEVSGRRHRSPRLSQNRT
jgi:DNA-binding SARP family transcriptional activator